MGTGAAYVNHAGFAARRGEYLNGVVGEDEAKASPIGPVVVNLELEGIVELALDVFRRSRDGDAGKDRQGVERVDVLVGLGGKGGDIQSLKLHDLVVTLRLGRVEATA